MSSPVLLCTGFHRSATSYTANWLRAAGLSLGRQLLPAHQSNPDGHFEDGRVVRLHDDWLDRNRTSWQFHGEITLREDEALRESIRGYIATRDAEGAWAFKDPRSCLSINAWHAELGERGRYLFIVRHWAECAQSLFQRHSRTLAHRLPPAEIAAPHLRFWVQPELAYAMWLAYNRMVLQFVQSHPEQSLVVTARGVTSTVDLPHLVESQLRIPISRAAKPVGRAASNPGRVNDAQLLPVSQASTAELDQLWIQLLQQSALRAEDESIEWISEPSAEAKLRKETKDVTQFTKRAVTKGKRLEVLQGEIFRLPIPERLRAVLASTRQTAADGRLRDSLLLLQWAIDIVPDSVPVLGLMAEIEEGAGELESALVHSLVALRQGKRPVDAVRTSRILMSLEQTARAKRLLEDAVLQHPEHLGVAVQYARCMIKLSEGGLALKALQQRLDHNASSLDLLAQLTFPSDYDEGLRLSLEAARKRIADRDHDQWLSQALALVDNESIREVLIGLIQSHWRAVELSIGENAIQNSAIPRIAKDL